MAEAAADLNGDVPEEAEDMGALEIDDSGKESLTVTFVPSAFMPVPLGHSLLEGHPPWVSLSPSSQWARCHGEAGAVLV